MYISYFFSKIGSNNIGNDGAKAIAAALILNENLKMKELILSIIKIFIKI